ncbi:hypothetical protein HMPREF1624_04579 [Sporothrix schenckii ATCC 58251]|uniref:Helicase ATP-binding domain-containing protein n=1 Tax=Sporothrix schenckii (strain ATCC 58251 / de Perez 2211183) TaxID=1391915 RepID=U7PXE7_SPOS1|nr:hypothetical protein HMPREF1624_04579 [Sporothrix schenckii ATCC 58251]
MSRSRSASFSDDDLMIVSSQAMSSQGYGSQGYGSQDYPSQELGGDLMSSPLQPIRAPNDVIDITSSPVAPALSQSKGSNSTAPTTQQPVFGRPTQMSMPTSSSSKPTMSSAAAAAAALVQRRQNALFNANQKRPEHHRPQRLTGPLAPKQPDRKAAPRPVFSSMASTQDNGGTSYPVSSFYSNTTTNKTIVKQSIPASMHADVDFYTDPDKATADLKALLEGGMEDDEDDEDEVPAAAAPPKETAKITAIGAAPEKAKKEPENKKDRQEPKGYDDGTVDGIKVKLLPHQVEGVKWMRGRELGPVKRGRVPKGGILADDMGLGKTLQAISLILTNPKPTKDMPGWKKHYEKITGGTLVVAPLALIRQWEAEIKEKVSRDPPLRVCVHHGPQRTVRPRDLAKFDVVITTYQILVSEHGHSSSALQSGCFGLHWYRIILDEAHSIKNRNAKMTKACCAMPAEFRWCLTGTPMQNNLDELQSLVNFLRITPYDNLTEWRNHIDVPLKNGRGYLAIRRLHSLLRCFMKRRTKDILKEEGALVPGGKKAIDAAAAASAAVAAAEEKGLKNGTQTPGTSDTSTSTPGAARVPTTPSFKITERNVVSVLAEFSPSERAFYDRLEERADKSLEKMMQGKSMSYANALVLLLRLRQACNHPDLLTFKLEKDKDAMSTDSMPASQKSATTDSDIDALADVFGGLGIQAKKCEVCMTDLTKDEQRDCEVAGDGMVCTKCIEDRGIVSGKPTTKKEKKDRKSKKHRKDKKSNKDKSQRHKAKKQAAAAADADAEDNDSILPASRRAATRKPRNRRAIVDSDDEEEEDGSWLVGEEERGALRLGKAGGEEDENAEGGGDWINSDDSIHESEDEDKDASRMSSFIEDDEMEDNPAASKGQKKHAKKKILRVGGQDWDSDESGDEDFESFAQSAGSDTESADESGDESGGDMGDDSESESGSDESLDGGNEEDSFISTSELLSNVDDESLLGRRSAASRKTKSGLGSSSHSDTVLVSAKIRKMLSILKKEAGEHKFIVFSQFTSMLSLVSPFLVRAGLGHVRYEGSMRNDAREASLNSLRHDPNVRVLLCSLKCGALGLNLTAATRVIILEPFWNPFVEEQAIDRVHRLTQTVDVTVYKLTVEDTVEERILALQDKKRLLAAQALEAGTAGGKGKKDALKLGLKELMDLFKHDSRGPPGMSNGGHNGEPGSVEAAFVDQFAALGSGLLRRREGGNGGSRAGGGASQDSAYSRRW